MFYTTLCHGPFLYFESLQRTPIFHIASLVSKFFFFEQVKTIRDGLRKVGLGDVDVETIENVQGMFEKPFKVPGNFTLLSTQSDFIECISWSGILLKDLLVELPTHGVFFDVMTASFLSKGGTILVLIEF